MATFTGTNGNDSLTGAHGFQFIFGLGGNDILDLDPNISYSELYGGDGNDTLDLTYPDPGAGLADGGAGNDSISGSGGRDELYGGSGDDSIFGASASRAIDLVDGGDGNDTIIAGGTLLGGAGNDRITSGGGADTIFGGEGNDTIDASIGSDNLYGGDGNDVLIADGNNGADRMHGGAGIDTVSYADVGTAVTIDFVGGVAQGAATGDFFFGIENLILSNGDDLAAGDTANNTFTGLGGDDLLDGSDGIDTVSYADKTTQVQVTLNGDTPVSVAVNGVSEDTIFNFENVIGGTGNDFLSGDGLANLLRGGVGADILNGVGGNDILDGEVGADFLNGGAGNDSFFVDNASDIVTDESGVDNVNTSVNYTLAVNLAVEILRTTNAAGVVPLSLTGNNLSNTVIGNVGNNILNGGGGIDTLQGLAGNDAYLVDNVGDKVIDTAGIDNVNASVSYALAANVAIETLRTVNATATTAIHLTGNQFANLVIGNAGANILNAGAGNDTLQGGLGGDILIGNLGRDVSTGGSGNDIFRYLATTHSPAGAGADVILDFDDSGNGTIDLSALFGPAMTYRHNLGFTAAGQVRINDVAGADVIVEVNTGGSLVADVQMRLVNTTLASMTAGDFMLL